MKALARLNSVARRLSSSGATTAATASAKPRKLQVPKLQSTLDRYLRSVRPFLTQEEYAKSESVVKDFGAPGGEGDKLQKLLYERAEREQNWLEAWWLQTAYLGYRSPVVVWSSPGEIFPWMKFSSENDVLKCATNVVSAALQFKLQVDRGEIAQEWFGRNPLDMNQYRMVFGTCRIPDIPLDALRFHPKSGHIVVAHKNHFYRVQVMDDGGVPLPKEVIYTRLDDCVKASDGLAPPVGVLTTDSRDNWAAAYKELSKDDWNMKSLKVLEECLFMVCLDSVAPVAGPNRMTESARLLIHGGGPDANSANRWFDKTIQFVIGKEGHIGMTYEHSPAEGQPIAVLTDHVVKHINDEFECTSDGGCGKPEELKFTVNKKVEQMIATARCNLENLVNDLEVNSFSFNGFGKEAIKHFKLSPDSFIQMAIQLAFYRTHNTPAAQYESASLRQFVGGRTETIRSCSVESVAFAKAMLDAKAPSSAKAKALRQAVNSHKEYTVAALNGEGVDRHLLGLRLIAKENNLPIPNLYSDPAFTRSSYMRMSTSQVASKCDAFMNYGPLVNDGYGCCYNPRKSNINFGTSALVSCPETSAAKLKPALERSLCEMLDALAANPPAKL